MLYIILTVIFWIVGFGLMSCALGIDNLSAMIIGFVLLILAIVMTINGCINGFINYPPTEGTHVGEITAIDLEGVWFRRWEVYLKSDGFSSDSDGKLSNETKYLLYENERELVEQLKEYQGKKVKLYYGFEGGRIKWNSCGTYHITKVELVEEK